MSSNHERVLQAIQQYKEATVILGNALKNMKNGEYWEEEIGEGVGGWAGYVEQPEIGLTVRQANQLCKLSEWLGVIKVPLGELNLSTANFGASRGISDPDLITDMKVLSLKDFKERNWEVKNEDKEQTYTYLLMKRSNETGSLSKVYGDELEVAKENLGNG